MPELPEVETICRGLKRSLLSKKITDVEVLRDESIGYPDPLLFAKSVPGHIFEDISRRGKYLLIQLSGGAGLAVHLRMSGRLLIVGDRTKPGRFMRVRMHLSSGQELRFEDMRVFGRLWYVPSGHTFAEVVPGLAHLGVEPLSGLTGKMLCELMDNKKQAIKSALLDQRLLAGIGNIYADEALFKARIHPKTAAGKLTRAQAGRLVEAIETVLNDAIALGGSSVRDYQNSEGINGNYQHAAFVYGRTGRSCKICKKKIKRIKLAGRSTHFCGYCQRLRS